MVAKQAKDLVKQMINVKVPTAKADWRPAGCYVAGYFGELVFQFGVIGGAYGAIWNLFWLGLGTIWRPCWDLWSLQEHLGTTWLPGASQEPPRSLPGASQEPQGESPGPSWIRFWSQLGPKLMQLGANLGPT